MVVEIKNRWIGYSVMLVQAILIAVCLSAVCYNVSSLPSIFWMDSGNGCMVVEFGLLWEW